VVKSEHGIALRKCPTLAFELIEAVVNTTKLPVSVKTRLGLNSHDDLIAFGKGVENAGASLLTIHGRTYSVPYGCPANFEPIYELKRNLKIPVIGNGGITSIDDGKIKLGNLDGFMIGQAAFGNPWVFSTNGFPTTFAEKIPVIIRHLNYLIELKGERVALLEIRKHLLAYVKGLPNATVFRSRLVRVESIKEAETILHEIAQSPQIDSRC
jgi:tRNA-dihydrouridine synthase B